MSRVPNKDDALKQQKPHYFLFKNVLSIFLKVTETSSQSPFNKQECIASPSYGLTSLENSASNICLKYPKDVFQTEELIELVVSIQVITKSYILSQPSATYYQQTVLLHFGFFFFLWQSGCQVHQVYLCRSCDN